MEWKTTEHTTANSSRHCVYLRYKRRLFDDDWQLLTTDNEEARHTSHPGDSSRNMGQSITHPQNAIY